MIRRLGVRETFFRQLLKKGKIPSRKYSRKLVRFNPLAVEAALVCYDIGVVKTGAAP
jgi:hypothetical protein